MLHADLDTKKFNKFSNPNFCAACQSCMQCAQKLMRGYQTLTLCHFFYEKEEVDVYEATVWSEIPET